MNATVAWPSSLLVNSGRLPDAASTVATPWRRSCSRTPTQPDEVPSRTVIVIQQSRLNALWWSEGSMSGKPMLQVVGDFNVTNIWSKDIKLAGALLKYKRWLFLTRTVRGDSSVKDLTSVYSGTYRIPPNQMTWLRVSFDFIPRDEMPTGVLKASVAVIDQFGNHHWIKNLSFKHPDAMLEP